MLNNMVKQSNSDLGFLHRNTKYLTTSTYRKLNDATQKDAYPHQQIRHKYHIPSSNSIIATTFLYQAIQYTTKINNKIEEIDTKSIRNTLSNNTGRLRLMSEPRAFLCNLNVSIHDHGSQCSQLSHSSPLSSYVYDQLITGTHWKSVIIYNFHGQSWIHLLYTVCPLCLT